MSTFVAVLWKDLLCEWRNHERLSAMVVFSLLLVVIFHFALPESSAPASRTYAPGLLWAAYVFAALLGHNRAFAAELENDALSGLALAPVDRGWIFLGKAAANFLVLAAVQFLTAAAFALAFELELAAHALPFAGIAALGALGLSCLGTLFAAVAVRTRFRDVLLPLLLFPLAIPLLAAAVHATAAILAGRGVPPASLHLLLVVDAVYAIVSFLSFEYVLDE